MNKPILKYGKFTEKKTKNIIGPEYKDVFADYSKLNTDYFFPLLSVNLEEINPEWEGVVYFIYCEYEESDNIKTLPITFKIQKDGRYKFEAKSYNRAMSYLKKSDFPICEYPEKWNGKYIELISFKASKNYDYYKLLKKSYSNNKNDYHDLYDHHWNMQVDAKKVNPDLRGKNPLYLYYKSLIIDRLPSWIQNQSTPLNPDGKKMEFIAQINADMLTDQAADFTLFLFYCPKYRLISQVAQIS